MNRLKWMQKCVSVNLCNWSVTPKIWIIIGIMAVYTIGNVSGVLEYSSEIGIRVTPWIFPHYFNVPAMWIVYGFLTVSLFSDAPFHNASSQFIEVRVGKKTWIQGQCLFIIEASLLYALLYFVMTFIISLPRIYFTAGWGKLIEKLVYSDVGAVQITGLIFDRNILEKFSPIQALFISLIILWLVSCFLGMLILACRIVIGGNAGNIAAGIEVFLAYFSIYIGVRVFGSRIFRFAPVSWINISVFCNEAGDYPDIFYSFSFLVLGIIIFSVIGIKAYEIKN